MAPKCVVADRGPPPEIRAENAAGQNSALARVKGTQMVMIVSIKNYTRHRGRPIRPSSTASYLSAIEAFRPNRRSSLAKHLEKSSPTGRYGFKSAPPPLDIPNGGPIPLILNEASFMSSSAVRLLCPNLKCRTILSVPVSARGKTVRCRSCGMRIQVPQPKSTGPTPAAADTGDAKK